MAEHNQLGAWGENLAAEYLLTRGYSIIERDFKAGRYELDIVAMTGTEIVFVEVKTRSDDFADPTDAIDSNKMRRLARAADVYLRMKRIRQAPRFDVIAVIGHPLTSHTIRHYPDAFMPPLMTGGCR